MERSNHTELEYDGYAQHSEDYKITWFKNAKFGMMIHWGLYSVLAGSWKGKPIPHLGEWIASIAGIPIQEYAAVAGRFNPVRFDAEEWVRLAQAAGMKYITITTKHHEGFAMYHSRASDFNIVDATPFQRDAIKELAEACRVHGLKLGLYYSQAIDFHHPDAKRSERFYPDQPDRNFERYLEEKAIPQIREILTEYGDVAVIWFDMPENMTFQQSKRIRDLVAELQPQSLIGGRLGNGQEEIRSMGDNEFPAQASILPWETVATINDTWGFKEHDHGWKSTAQLLRLLVLIASRGGNYTLNVGPTGEGVIPAPTVDRLQEIGKWLSVNGEAVYEASAGPFPESWSWGAATLKGKRMYLHVFEWPQGELVLFGLITKAKGAYVLETGETVGVVQMFRQELDHHILRLKLPRQQPNPHVSVIVIDLEDEAVAQQSISQQPGGEIVLKPSAGILKRGTTDSLIRIDNRGVVADWFDTADWFQWDFKVIGPGEYTIQMETMTQKYNATWNGEWEGGHQFELETAGQSIRFTAHEDRRYTPRDLYYYEHVISRCGTVRIDEPGVYSLNLKPITLKTAMGLGPKLCSIELKIN